MVRRSIRAMLVTIAVVGCMTVLSTGPAAACSCAGFPSDQAALDSADVVFSGELIEVRTPTGESFSSMDPERFLFEVSHVYKGDARARQSVVTQRDGASCGLELTGRGPFLVFAHEESDFDLELEDGELSSHLCTGSRSLSESPVPAAFGSGTPPSEGASPIGDPDAGESRAPILAGVAGALSLATAYLFVRVRRARRPPGSLGGEVGVVAAD